MDVNLNYFTPLSHNLIQETHKVCSYILHEHVYEINQHVA